jgi:hypothetical protein
VLHQARDGSASGSSPSVAEKRTFRVLSVRTVEGEVRPAYAPSEIPQPYAALYIVWSQALIPLSPIQPPGAGMPRPYSGSDTNVGEFTY